jgi:hypothetical protein
VALGLLFKDMKVEGVYLDRELEPVERGRGTQEGDGEVKIINVHSIKV